MTLKFLTMFILALSLFACSGGKTGEALDEAYYRLESVSPEAWDILAGQRIFFGHQSVGYNVIEGLKEVLRRVPYIRLAIRETSDIRDFDSAVFAHAAIGTNRDPMGKIDHFRNLMESGIGDQADIVFFKFCYVDIDQTTDVDKLLEYYDKTIEALKARYPKLRIIPVTVPLTTTSPGLKALIKRLFGRGASLKAENIERNLVNEHLRRAYGRDIWDLADAETSSPDGAKESFQDGPKTYYLLSRPYTSDGGHLNLLGSQIIAIDLLLRLISDGKN